LTGTDANGNTTSISYLGADLTAVTNPLGNGTSIGKDLVGRLVSMSNPLFAQTVTAYDALNEVTSFTDANGAQSQFAYDANSNLLSLTDPRTKTTAFSYDSLNRTLTRTDPLNQVEKYAYEPGGLVNQLTDRKAQVSGATYDGLGRATQIGFGATTKRPTTYTSTVAQTWDAGNRLTKIVDSIGGTINRTYDGLDRLTLESTPRGSVSYTYDGAGRRMSMTVQGQPVVSYTWDAANRLIQLQQAAGIINGNQIQTISFQYDNANRRTQAVLSNGVTIAYAYDAADELTGLTYTQANGTLIGNLTYTYDVAGRRSSVGGSLAPSSVPTTASTGTYDANNRVTNSNGSTITYDVDGNTLTDGSNTYTWDARNQLTSLTGPVNGSFKYDAVGRRVQKILGATTTGFLYDGYNFAQEQSATGVATATILTGGIDEIFARMTSAGISVPLTEALGSVIAETNSAAGVTTTFSYEPFGRTTQTGTSSGNSQQFTGRENDGTGVYYYRARYYSPGRGRFVSEDPIGFAGGINPYAYVDGDPIDYRDPEGKLGIPGAIVSAALNVAVQTLIEGKSLRCVDISEVLISGAVGLFTPGVVNIARFAGGASAVTSQWPGFTTVDLVLWQGLGSVTGFVGEKAVKKKPWTVGSDCECSNE
jgi:RHS repeat-associated protein